MLNINYACIKTFLISMNMILLYDLVDNGNNNNKNKYLL